MEKKMSWPRYLSLCKKLCPESLSFPMLCNLIPFFRAYELGVPHRAIMCEIDHVAHNKFFADWSGEQRYEWINKRIEELAQ